jgi:lipid-binding SYLF domain-containing protein
VLECNIGPSWQIICVLYNGTIIIYITKNNFMKKINEFCKRAFLLAMPLLFFTVMLQAQDAKDQRIAADSRKAKSEFIKTDKLMQSLFNNAYGYVIFPNVGKAGAGVGGAAGNGIVYEKGNLVGAAKMKQVSVGLQMGGQLYSEVIFFESPDALNKFKDGKFEFSGQASAVAVKAGASANVKYREGVMVFTRAKGGLMYEAALGGQKFNYKAF